MDHDGEDRPTAEIMSGSIDDEPAAVARILIARPALIEAIFSDPDWERTFTTWAAEPGLAESITECRRRDPDDVAPIKCLAVVIESLASRVSDLAVDFAGAKLKLPWPWVAEDMARTFLWDAMAAGIGQDLTLSVEIIREGSPAPSVRVPAVRTAKGDTVETLLERLDAHIRNTKQLRAEVAATTAAPARGSNDKPMPAAGGAIVKRHVGWFYRVRVKGEPIAQLAREHHAERHPQLDCDCDAKDDASTIRTGIAAAEMALMEAVPERGGEINSPPKT